jgi:hypothetical protein
VKRPRKRTTIEVTGGLGSQLLQYFAGAYQANLYDSDLVIDMIAASNSHSKDSDLTSFELPGNFKYTNPKFLPIRLQARKVFDSLAFRVPILARPLIHFLGIYLDPPLSSFNSNRKFLESTGPLRMKGFFLSYGYLRALQRNGMFTSIELVAPSLWFQGLKTQVEIIDPIIMHIRRGDYLFHQDSLGVLSEQYFERAMKIALEGDINRAVWVFSNDLESISDWKFLSAGNIQLINEPDGVDPAEVLKLFTLSSALVISNSTFSFFGGMLNAKNPKVFCPIPTSKAPNIHSKDWFPPEWISVPAEYI